MKKFPFKIKEGSAVHALGQVAAESEKEALHAVLSGECHDFEPKEDGCYSVSVGETMASCYGDEFKRVAGASSIDEEALLAGESSDYLFDDPVRKELEEKCITQKDYDDFIDAATAGKKYRDEWLRREAKGYETDLSGHPINRHESDTVIQDLMKKASEMCPASHGGQHSFNNDIMIDKKGKATEKHGQCTCGAIEPVGTGWKPQSANDVRHGHFDEVQFPRDFQLEIESLDRGRTICGAGSVPMPPIVTRKTCSFSLSKADLNRMGIPSFLALMNMPEIMVGPHKVMVTHVAIEQHFDSEIARIEGKVVG